MAGLLIRRRHPQSRAERETKMQKEYVIQEGASFAQADGFKELIERKSSLAGFSSWAATVSISSILCVLVVQVCTYLGGLQPGLHIPPETIGRTGSGPWKTLASMVDGMVAVIVIMAVFSVLLILIGLVLNRRSGDMSLPEFIFYFFIALGISGGLFFGLHQIGKEDGNQNWGRTVKIVINKGNVKKVISASGEQGLSIHEQSVWTYVSAQSMMHKGVEKKGLLNLKDQVIELDALTMEQVKLWGLRPRVLHSLDMAVFGEPVGQVAKDYAMKREQLQKDTVVLTQIMGGSALAFAALAIASGWVGYRLRRRISRLQDMEQELRQGACQAEIVPVRTATVIPAILPSQQDTHIATYIDLYNEPKMGVS